MALESIYADSFLDSLLRGDTDLIGASGLDGAYIYKGVAPQAAPFPRVVFNLQAGVDNNSISKTRLFASLAYQVRTVGKLESGALLDPSRVRAAANRVDELLKEVRRVSHTVDGVTYFFNTWRETELPNRDESGATADESYRNYGGLYRVEVFT